MKELLQKLLEAEVLTEETKAELEGAFTSQLEEAIAAAKEETAADVRAELTEEWVNEKENLVEAIDTKVGEMCSTEFEELKEDIERFRDLEADFAEKLVEAKAAMSDELKGDLAELVEKINSFLEIRLAAEMEELHEDITEQRKNMFGRKIFEAYAEEFTMDYADEESAEATLRETEERLKEAQEALDESERKTAKMERSIKMEEVLSPLDGKQKEVMEAILRNVDTQSLEEGYKTFIGRVIRENEEADSEKEGEVLAEGASEEDGEKDETLVEGDVVTGDTDEVIEESENLNPEMAQRIAHLQMLAGIETK